MDEQKKNELDARLKENAQKLERAEERRSANGIVTETGTRYIPGPDDFEKRQAFFAANPPDKARVEKALKWLTAAYEKNRYQDTSGIGAYLLEEFFGGDYRTATKDAIRDNGSFQYLLDRYEAKHLPFMPELLVRVLKARVLELSVSESTGSNILKRLSFGHKSVFIQFSRLCDSPPMVKKLAEETLRRGWSIRELKKAALKRARRQ